MSEWHFIRHLPPLPEAYNYLYGRGEVPVDSKSDIVLGRVAEIAKRLPSQAVWHVSPTPRTLLTEQRLLETSRAFQQVARIEDKAFIEQDFSIFADRRRSNLRTDPLFEEFRNGEPFTRAPNGESFIDVVGRVGARVQELSHSDDDPDRVIVTHGGVLLALACHALKIPVEEVRRYYSISPLMHIIYKCEPDFDAPEVKILRHYIMSQGVDLRHR